VCNGGEEFAPGSCRDRSSLSFGDSGGRDDDAQNSRLPSPAELKPERTNALAGFNALSGPRIARTRTTVAGRQRGPRAAHVRAKNRELWKGSANPQQSYTAVLDEDLAFVRFVNPGDLRAATVSCARRAC
jgi:hypothetical protein